MKKTTVRGEAILIATSDHHAAQGRNQQQKAVNWAPTHPFFLSF